jgi:hypothetical protein
VSVRGRSFSGHWAGQPAHAPCFPASEACVKDSSVVVRYTGQEGRPFLPLCLHTRPLCDVSIKSVLISKFQSRPSNFAADSRDIEDAYVSLVHVHVYACIHACGLTVRLQDDNQKVKKKCASDPSGPMYLLQSGYLFKFCLSCGTPPCISPLSHPKPTEQYWKPNIDETLIICRHPIGRGGAVRRIRRAAQEAGNRATRKRDWPLPRVIRC